MPGHDADPQSRNVQEATRQLRACSDVRGGGQTMQTVYLVNERRGTYPHPRCINLWTVRGQLRPRRQGSPCPLRCQRIEQIGPDQDCASPRPGCRISVMRPTQIRSDTLARRPRVPESRSFAMLNNNAFGALCSIGNSSAVILSAAGTGYPDCPNLLEVEGAILLRRSGLLPSGGQPESGR